MNVDAVRHYLKNPIDFVRDILKANPEPQQIELLNSLTLKRPIAARAGHGVGKTAVAAWAILWFLALHPLAKIPCTAPTIHQLDDVLWPEVKKWLDGSLIRDTMTWTKTRLSVNGYDATWFAVPRASNRAENVQGFHGDHVLVVVDEAPGVEQDVMEAIEGAMTNDGAMVLMIGNPTKLSGTFYDAFHKDRALYDTHVFSCLNSPLVSQTYIDRISDKYGKDSDVYRIRVEGQFPKGTPDSFIRVDAVESAVNRTVEPTGPLVIGVDPARYGNDNSVIYCRRGYKVFEPRSFNGINTTRLAGETALMVKGMRAMFPDLGTIEVNVDDTGLGGGVTDQLEEQEYELDIMVNAVNFGGSGDDDHADTGAMMWGNIKTLLPFLDLPDRSELISQLTTRKYQVQPNGKIKLERKEAMKKRGIPSPDEPDALGLSLWDPDVGSIRMF